MATEVRLLEEHRDEFVALEEEGNEVVRETMEEPIEQEASMIEVQSQYN